MNDYTKHEECFRKVTFMCLIISVTGMGALCNIDVRSFVLINVLQMCHCIILVSHSGLGTYLCAWRNIHVVKLKWLAWYNLLRWNYITDWQLKRVDVHEELPVCIIIKEYIYSHIGGTNILAYLLCHIQFSVFSSTPLQQLLPRRVRDNSSASEVFAFIWIFV